MTSSKKVLRESLGYGVKTRVCSKFRIFSKKKQKQKKLTLKTHPHVHCGETLSDFSLRDSAFEVFSLYLGHDTGTKHVSLLLI